jgi:hypothetical protein
LRRAPETLQSLWHHSCEAFGNGFGPSLRYYALLNAGSGLSLRYALLNALDLEFHCVRTPWIRGFMTFQLVRRIEA